MRENILNGNIYDIADIPKLRVILQQTWRGIYGKTEILL